MKLRIYFRPSLVVLLLGPIAVLLWLVALELGALAAVITVPLSIFYSLLFGLSAWSLWRIHILERWAHWDSPQRLLILAPHEDDCVIAAGGVGLRNIRLGGATRIVYLAPEEAADKAELRAKEATAAWREAGLGESHLMRLDLLPPLQRRDPAKLRKAAVALRSIIDDFRPTVVVTPMFEGGHIHHDMVAALVRSIATAQDSFELLEAPEYGPYASVTHTPHRIIALCARWLAGLVSYYGPPDGVDDRPIRKYRLDPSEMECKRRMLSAFVSQNAPSLVATRCYPDRLVLCQRGPQRRAPFDYAHSYLRFVQLARRLLPAAIVDRLFPVQLGTVGREGSLTDWREEWSPGADRDERGG